MSLHIVEEQMNYETRMWLQVVTQLKLVIPAPDAVLVGVKLWLRENGSPILKTEISLFKFRHLLS